MHLIKISEYGSVVLKEKTIWRREEVEEKKKQNKSSQKGNEISIFKTCVFFSLLLLHSTRDIGFFLQAGEYWKTIRKQKKTERIGHV